MATEEGKTTTTTTQAPVNEGTSIEDLTSNARETFEKFKWIIVGIAVLAIAGGMYIYYSASSAAAADKKASAAMYKAERKFEQGLFVESLNGKNEAGAADNFTGFIDIIKKYKGTSSANAAYYYAGTAYLNIGEPDNAIKFLSNFSSSDEITQAMAYSLMGDAYAELDKKDDALSYYQKAVSYSSNDVSTPFALQKLAFFQEHLGKKDEAINSLKQLKTEYPQMAQNLQIEKELFRLTGEYK